MELVGLPWVRQDERPFSTILELKKLRDLIAHAKPEKFTGEVVHAANEPAPFHVPTLRSMFTPKEKLSRAVHDVEQFLNQIHNLAAPKVKDIWFGKEALYGPQQYSVGDTHVSQ
jgi:hypothetical protein